MCMHVCVHQVCTLCVMCSLCFCVSVSVFTCVCIFICMYVCMYVLAIGRDSSRYAILKHETQSTKSAK